MFVSNWTVNVSEAPGARLGDSPSVSVKPVGTVTAPSVSVVEPSLRTVNTRLTAALSLIEPSIMIFMGAFVAFVLVALYLPIFSLADTLR